MILFSPITHHSINQAMKKRTSLTDYLKEFATYKVRSRSTHIAVQAPRFNPFRLAGCQRGEIMADETTEVNCFVNFFDFQS